MKIRAYFLALVLIQVSCVWSIIDASQYTHASLLESIFWILFVTVSTAICGNFGSYDLRRS